MKKALLFFLWILSACNEDRIEPVEKLESLPPVPILADSLEGERLFSRGNSLIDSARWADAVLCLEKALLIRKAMPKESDAKILDNYYRLGIALKGAKDYGPALNYLSELAALTAASRSDWFFKTRLRMGEVYFDMKEPGIALDILTKTWEEIEKNGNCSTWIKTDILSNISFCLRDLGKLEEAISWGSKALPWTGVIDPDEAARVHMAIGNAWADSVANLKVDNISQTLDFQRAVAHADSAKFHYGRAGDRYFREVVIQSGNLGELYRRAGLLEEAVSELENTLHTFPKDSIPGRTLSQMYVNLGEARFDQDSIALALTYFDSALFYLASEYQPGKNSPVPSPSYENPISDRTFMAAVLSDMANATLTRCEKEGYKDQALKERGISMYDSLLVLVNVMRGGYLTEEAKLNLAENIQKPLRQAFQWYGKLLEAYPELREELSGRAFHISEQSKAFALLEAARKNNYFEALPKDLEGKERKLIGALSDLEQEIILNWANEESRKKLEEQKAAAIGNLVLFKKELEDRAPSYFSLRYKGADLPVSVIRSELLDPGQALVEYFIEDSTLNIFFVSGEVFRLERTPISRDSLGSLVERFLYLQAHPTASNQGEFCLTAQELYRILLKPIEEESINRLIIIPDGPLNRLAFEALVIDRGDGNLKKIIADSGLVLHRYAITYCFSANLLQVMAEKRTPSGLRNRVAVFGPAYHSAIAKSSHPLFKWTASLLPMAHNQQIQMQGISEGAPSDAFGDSSATVDNFLGACTQYAFVHVIAHGFLDERDPNLSCVVFSQSRETLDENNLLMLKNLYSSRLNQELIGFSSCKTASGVYREGEGNMSMARGLAYAGVRSFLTTLWDIPNDGVAQMMPDFYNRLLNGWNRKPKDIALAEAKRKYLAGATLDAQIQPLNWSGIVLIGAADYGTAATEWRWTLALGVFILIVLFAFRLRKRKRT